MQMIISTSIWRRYRSIVTFTSNAVDTMYHYELISRDRND